MPKTKKEIPDPLPSDLYEVLACPTDKSELKYTKDKSNLQCTKCKCIYPINNGIPVLLPPEIKQI